MSWSWVVLTYLSLSMNRYEELEVQNFDAWLQAAGGCDGASTESGKIKLVNLGAGVACQDALAGNGYIM